MVRDGSLNLKFLCKPYLEISALRDRPALMGKVQKHDSTYSACDNKRGDII